MKKIFTTLALAIASVLMIAPISQAFAQPADTAKPAVKKPVKKTVKKTTKKSKTAKKSSKATHPKTADSAGSGKKIPLSEDNDDESSEPDIAGSITYEYNCELGDKITAYKNEGDNKFIAIRWAKHIHRLKRVSTTTGADRFENRLAGLVWIGIPAKSMLLDSKKGQQLANECKLSEPVASASAAAKS